MKGRTIVVMVDLMFLTLGGLLVAMTRMETVETVPVEITEVAPGEAGTTSGDLVTVTVVDDELYVNGLAVTREELLEQVRGEDVVLYAERTSATSWGDVIRLLAGLRGSARSVEFRVDST